MYLIPNMKTRTHSDFSILWLLGGPEPDSLIEVLSFSIYKISTEGIMGFLQRIYQASWDLGSWLTATACQNCDSGQWVLFSGKRLKCNFKCKSKIRIADSLSFWHSCYFLRLTHMNDWRWKWITWNKFQLIFTI